MLTRLSQRPFLDELPEVLRERGLSQRALAGMVGVQPSHLSRLLRRKDFKKAASPQLIEAVSAALELPRDYWPEAREAYVVARIREDRRLLDDVYRLLKNQ